MKTKHILSAFTLGICMILAGALKAQIIPPSCNFGSNVIPCPTFILGQENSGSLGSFTGSEEWSAIGKAPFPAPSGDLPYGIRLQRNLTTSLFQVERRSTTSPLAPIWDSNILFGDVIINSPIDQNGFPRMDFKYVQQNQTTVPPSIRTVNIMTLTPATSKQITPGGLTAFCFFGASPCFGRVGIENVNPSFTLDVNGIGRATAFILTSDARYKQDINTIENGMAVINNLRGTTYEFVDSEKFEDLDFAEGLRSGFIAQEIEEVLPHTVYTDDKGYKSVDYIAVIPYLVEGMKDLDAQNSQIKAEIAQLRSDIANAPTGKGAASSSIGDLRPAELMQNFPNPFDQETKINYYLPEGVQQASMLVFDMNGRQLRAYDIEVGGEGSLVISGAELEAGMYFYSLVADGEEVATKRMILTK